VCKPLPAWQWALPSASWEGDKGYLKEEMLRKVWIYNFRHQMKKKERMGHVACMEAMRNAYRLVQKTWRENNFSNLGIDGEDNIKINL
jgi:hypothetical protein